MTDKKDKTCQDNLEKVCDGQSRENCRGYCKYDTKSQKCVFNKADYNVNCKCNLDKTKCSCFMDNFPTYISAGESGSHWSWVCN